MRSGAKWCEEVRSGVKEGLEVEYMAWIGIECGVEAHDLEKWARYVENAGGGGSGSAGGVADLLRRCAKLVSGVGITGVSETQRLREIEMRAVDAIERKRADASNAATAIVGRVMGYGGGLRGNKTDDKMDGMWVM